MSHPCSSQGCSKVGTLYSEAEARYYCSKECQLADWKARHKLEHGEINKGICCQCNVAPGLKKCSRCKVIRYCSVECQKKHWPTHKTSCGKYAQGDPKSSGLLRKLHPAFLSIIVCDYFKSAKLNFADYSGAALRINSDEMFKDHSNYLPFLTIIPMTEGQMKILLSVANAEAYSGSIDRMERNPDVFIFAIIYKGSWLIQGIDRSSLDIASKF